MKLAPGSSGAGFEISLQGQAIAAVPGVGIECMNRPALNATNSGSDRRFFRAFPLRDTVVAIILYALSHLTLEPECCYPSMVNTRRVWPTILPSRVSVWTHTSRSASSDPRAKLLGAWRCLPIHLECAGKASAIGRSILNPLDVDWTST